MSQETSLQKRLIAKRADALAVINLTRRNDLKIAKQKSDIGFDFLVTLKSDEKPGIRQFGVEVKAVLSQLTLDGANEALLPLMRRIVRHAPFPYPMAVFFFTMENDQGWYAWAAEPVVSEGGCKLIDHEIADCRPLDDQGVNDVVAAVDRWYDAKYAAFPLRQRKAAIERKIVRESHRE